MTAVPGGARDGTVGCVRFGPRLVLWSRTRADPWVRLLRYEGRIGRGRLGVRRVALA